MSHLTESLIDNTRVQENAFLSVDNVPIDQIGSYGNRSVRIYQEITESTFDSMKIAACNRLFVPHVVELISATTTKTGLTVRCKLDTGQFPKGVVVSDAEMAFLNVKRAEFHGEWNYTISPNIYPPDCALICNGPLV
jgi:hypothetical protein